MHIQPVAKVTGAISSGTQEKLVGSVPKDQRANAKVKLQVHQSTYQRAKAPSSQGEVFKVPQLFLRIDGELVPPDEGEFLHAGQ